MRGSSFAQTYMGIGTIFGIILAAPIWYQALIGFHTPSDGAELQSLLTVLLIATIRGVLRSFAWLPSLVYHVFMHHAPFSEWLFAGWW